MYGIFRECWVDLKRYGGLGNGSIWIIFWLLLLISSIYLIVKESDVRKKIIFGVMPLVVVAGSVVSVIVLREVNQRFARFSLPSAVDGVYILIEGLSPARLISPFEIM